MFLFEEGVESGLLTDLPLPSCVDLGPNDL